MAKLVTDFVKIAQSGPCIDGRNIDAQWLTDMAETYDPAVYEARIWPDHIRWGNNYGAVVELDAREGEGRTDLYARLAPNAQYVWENQFDQKLHFSIEVAPNFAETGRCYLAGLGITDSPASLGTDALKFSQRRAGQASQFFSNVHAVDLRPVAEPDSMPGWFKKFMATFTPTPTPHPQEDSMDPKQFDAFSQRLEGMEATLQEMKGLFAADADKSPAPETTATPATAEAVAVSAGQFAAEIGKALAPMLDGMQKLSAEVAAIGQRFEAAKPGTHTHASTGPASDAAPLL